MGNMYEDAKVWSPFVGCGFDCVYCRPSFQAQAKRQKKNCASCYIYAPHNHPERLPRIPAAPIVFVCGSSDLAFATDAYRLDIVAALRGHAYRRHKRLLPPVEYYLQSKDPRWMGKHASSLPWSTTLVTTLETNRNQGYGDISRAPKPEQRWKDFASIEWPRKVLTLEPLLDFDVPDLLDMVVTVKPLQVWLGLNSKPHRVTLPEPPPEKLLDLARGLKKAGIPVRAKDLRGLVLP